MFSPRLCGFLLGVLVSSASKNTSVGLISKKAEDLVLC